MRCFYDRIFCGFYPTYEELKQIIFIYRFKSNVTFFTI